MKRFVVKTVAAFGVLRCLCGAEISFPGAGGDLSSGWGTVPGPSDTVVIAQGGAYSAGSDISFGNIKVTTGSPVVFNLAPSRKVTLNTAAVSADVGYPGTVGYGFAPLCSGAVSVTLDGGYWDFVKGNHFYAAASGNGDTGGDVTITGGAVVTNVNIFYYGEHSRRNNVIIDDAKVYASELNNWATGDHNLLEIRNGGEMHVSNTMYSDKAGNPGATSGYNEIYVHGEGTLFNLPSASSVSRLGYDHQAATLRIADKASLNVAGGLKLATNSGSSNNLFSVESGATATVGTLYLNGTAPFSRVVVSNATLSVNTLNFQCSASAASNEISIIDGAVLKGGVMATLIELNRSYGNKLTIENSTLSFPYVLLGKTGCYGGNAYRIFNGADVTNTSVSTAGQGTMFNAIIVSNAVWTTQGAYIGTSGGSCNKMIVQDGALVRGSSSSGFLLGADALSVSNRIEVSNGSSLVMENAAGMLEIGRGGSFNEVVVEDSDVTCGYVQLASEETGHDNRLVVENSQFSTLRSYPNGNTVYTLDPFGAGYGNEFVLDGSTWDVGSAYLRVSRTGSNNVFRLLNGARLVSTTKTVSVGETSEKSKNNLFYVGAGSTAELIRLRMMCLESKVTVSNGAIAVSESLNLGYTEANVNSFSANNTLRLEGETPSVSAAGQMAFVRHASLEVAVPKKKFAEGHIPVLAKSIVFDATSRIKVEGEEFFAKTGGRVCLAEATDSITLPEAAANASLQALPPGCRLFVSGRKLYFSSPSKLSTGIVIR